MPRSYFQVVNDDVQKDSEEDLIITLAKAEESGVALLGIPRKQSQMRRIDAVTVCKGCHAVYEGVHMDVPCPGCGATRPLAASPEEMAESLLGIMNKDDTEADPANWRVEL